VDRTAGLSGAALGPISHAARADRVVNLLTFALGVNSLALHRHHSRSSDPPTTQAVA
jgi:hypothetical protein